MAIYPKFIDLLRCVAKKHTASELKGDPPPLRVVGGATIEPRIRINRPDDENYKKEGFKCPGSAQRFLSTHAATYNTFNVQRHLTSAKTHRSFRASAMHMWREAVGVV